jgi:hypothetical protein
MLFAHLAQTTYPPYFCIVLHILPYNVYFDVHKRGFGCAGSKFEARSGKAVQNLL